jgi:hypothetical protein
VATAAAAESATGDDDAYAVTRGAPLGLNLNDMDDLFE